MSDKEDVKIIAFPDISRNEFGNPESGGPRSADKTGIAVDKRGRVIELFGTRRAVKKVGNARTGADTQSPIDLDLGGFFCDPPAPGEIPAEEPSAAKGELGFEEAFLDIYRAAERMNMGAEDVAGLDITICRKMSVLDRHTKGRYNRQTLADSQKVIKNWGTDEIFKAIQDITESECLRRPAFYKALLIIARLRLFDR